MGACHSIYRPKTTIRAKDKNNQKYHKSLYINTSNEIKFQKTSKKNNETDITSFNNKCETTPSNLSSNSTCAQINPPNNFTIQAIIGETEIPISVEEKEKIIIKINPNSGNNENNNMWSFLRNENPVNFLGYNNHKYKGINLGALFLRITGDQKVYILNKTENHIISKNKGNLLIYANLDPNNYLIYEPKGSINISIYGGSYAFENELYYSYNINCFSNKNKIDIENKEYKILDYINKARDNIKKFFNDYYSINDIINSEFKDFINKNNIKRYEFKMSTDLSNIAKKQCEFLYENETTGNIGSELKNKINYYYNCVNCDESIIYNINNPLLIVKNLIQDKYSKKKKNRKNLFSMKFNKVGIYLKEHKIYKFCCVIVFSD